MAASSSAVHIPQTPSGHMAVARPSEASADYEKGSVDTSADDVESNPSRLTLPRPPFMVSVLTIFLCVIVFVPYAFVAALLLFLALLELLVAKMCSSQRRPPDELVFVRMERCCRSCVENAVASLTPAKSAGCLSNLLLPSLYIQSSDRHKDYINEGKAMVEEIDEEIKVCKELVKVARERRRQHSKAAVASPDRTKDYCDSIKDSDNLRRHLDTLQKDREEIMFLAKTQATADYTGYYGLADWANRVLENHKDLMNAVSTISFVGAGLTYSTIFSATRGNIGLMSYAFGLFNCGFIIPMAALSLLKWASSRSRETMFASPQVWSLLLSFFTYLSVVAVGGAVCLLNVTIIYLHYSPPSSDSPPQFNVGPVPAGAFALVCAAITCVLTALALLLHYLVNGWDHLFGALLARQSEKEARIQRFREYMPE